VRRFLLLAIALTGGCDRVFGLEGRTPPDVALPPDASLAAVDAPLDASDRFGDVSVVALQCPSTRAAGDISLDLAETTFFYACATPTEANIYSAARTDDATGGPPTEIVATIANEGSPEVSPSGLEIYFLTFTAASIGKIDLVTRTSVGAPWVPVTPASGLNTLGDDRPGSTDSTNAYIVISRAGVLHELHYATGIWVDLGTIHPSTPAGAVNPHLSADGLTLVFAAGGTAKDLYVAQRAALGGVWGVPVAITEVNTSTDEADPWLSADGRRLYFARGGLVVVARK
jgi:hypothetical protein